MSREAVHPAVAALGLFKDDSYCEAPEDWYRDDGRTYVFLSIYGDEAVLHEFGALDKSLAGARTGVGREAMRTLRPHFSRIVASGVGEPHPDEDETLADYGAQPAFLFWRSMLREGLVDEISLAPCGTRVTRDGLAEPIETPYARAEPDPRDLAPGPTP